MTAPLDEKKLLERVIAERDRHVIGYPGPRREVAELLDQVSTYIVTLSSAQAALAAMRAERDELAYLHSERDQGDKIADEQLDGLRAQVLRLTEEISRCHARLEIDRVYVAEGEDLVERSVPMDERLSMPDGIEARDATISLLTEENETLRKVASECASSLMNGAAISTEASIDFMKLLPTEIQTVVLALKARIKALEEALAHLAECNLSNPHDFRQFACSALKENAL